MNPNKRRHFLYQLATGSLLFTPLAGILPGCHSHSSDWPEGMHPIVWDRDQCTRCGMAISDPRFAAEIRGGPDHTAFKFDDIGCLIVWLTHETVTYPWMSATDTRIWVADVNNQREPFHWLNAHHAHFIPKTSPMGYNFGAVSAPQESSQDFESVRRHISRAKGK